MGKDLRGKELGNGLRQQKNGLYLARLNIGDKRIMKRSKSLQECRKWLADTEYSYLHSDITKYDKLTVDGWYEYWKQNKEKTVRASTYKQYVKRYELHIKDMIGTMLIKDVKPLHCQLIFNKMSDSGLKSSTIHQTRIVLFNLFELAKANEIINSNPCNKSVRSNIGEISKPREALDIDTQKMFISAIRGTPYEKQYNFILQTGLRTGELVGLKWEDVDFRNKTLKIQRSMYYDYKDKNWKIGFPKTESGIRTIPLTDTAIRILKWQKEDNSNLKVVPMEYGDFVFLNREGMPITNSSYDLNLMRICKNAGIEKISMHILRHCFATRCIEGGVRPKTVQALLGHSKLSITMDLYVSVTDDEKKKELDKVADILNVG